MKKIIDGKLFDTDKSEKLCEYEVYNIFFGNINYVLYRTKKGNFFATKNRPIESWFEVSDEGVKNVLAEQNPEKYIELFGNVEEA